MNRDRRPIAVDDKSGLWRDLALILLGAAVGALAALWLWPLLAS